jgi:hypothetical protein
MDEISWVLNKGCTIVDVIKYTITIVDVRRMNKLEAMAREEEEWRGMSMTEENETDEDKEDEEENTEYTTKKEPRWRGGSISLSCEVEEQEQILIQTKHGYLRREGACRVIFKMWPTAARKLRTEKQMDAGRKKSIWTIEERRQHNWRKMKKITTLLECGTP